MTVTHPPMELGDYLQVLRRRKATLLVPFFLILAISLGLAFGLPPVYRSEATIVVERQEIPQDVVETTVTGYVEERIEGLSKRLLTWDTLWNMAEKLDLYPHKRHQKGSQGEIVKRMKEAISVEMLDVQASDPDNARRGTLTIAFTVAFEDSEPEIAQKVADELATLYIEENKRQRAEQAAQVSDFLSKEASRLRVELGDLEKKLAAFKQKNVDQLPGLQPMNLRFFEQTQSHLNSTDERIRALENQRMSLTSQLSITNPYKELYTDSGKRVLTSTERLSVLTTQYLSASANYSPEHPDLIKMRHEIKALEAELGATSKASNLVSQLTFYQQKLAEVRAKYSEEHPDVQKLQQSVAVIEKQIRNSTYADATTQAGSVQTPNNPAYVNLKTQLNTVVANLQAEEEKRQRLSVKLTEYEARLTQTPAVERDYLEISRDYENARKKYQEIKAKQSEAELAQQLEVGSQAERFVSVQPAYLPTLPERPNRLGIALLGFVFAFGGGVGAAAVAEYSDRTLRGSRGVLIAFQAPPLAIIPYIRTPEEIASRRRRIIRASVILAVAIILGLAAAGMF